MKILALETSAVSASAALCEDETLIAQTFSNSGLTHSRTLMPMVEGMLNNSGWQLSDVELVAVASGPGSFTGLRIGVAAAKGLGWAMEKPCCGVSTLEAMAWNLAHMDATICCAMDARRNQVYNAVFSARAGSLQRLTPDRAISLAELMEEQKETKRSYIFVGDGAKLCYNEEKAQGLSGALAPPHLLYQSGWGVARAALEKARRGEVTSAGDLEAVYLRLSQAERERMERLGAKEGQPSLR